MVHFISIRLRPTSHKFNKGDFFNKILNAISKSLNNYDNIALARELNIDLSDPSKDASDQLSDLLDVFDVKNLVQKSTCFKSKIGSLKCFILTNKPKV